MISAKLLILALQCVAHAHEISSTAKVDLDPMPAKTFSALSLWIMEWLKRHKSFLVVGFHSLVNDLIKGIATKTARCIIEAAFPLDRILDAGNSDIPADISICNDSTDEDGLLCIIEVTAIGTEIVHICEVTDIAAVEIFYDSLTLLFNPSAGLPEQLSSLQLSAVGGEKGHPFAFADNLPPRSWRRKQY